MAVSGFTFRNRLAAVPHAEKTFTPDRLDAAWRVRVAAPVAPSPPSVRPQVANVRRRGAIFDLIEALAPDAVQTPFANGLRRCQARVNREIVPGDVVVYCPARFEIKILRHFQFPFAPSTARAAASGIPA